MDAEFISGHKSCALDPFNQKNSAYSEQSELMIKMINSSGESFDKISMEELGKFNFISETENLFTRNNRFWLWKGFIPKKVFLCCSIIQVKIFVFSGKVDVKPEKSRSKDSIRGENIKVKSFHKASASGTASPWTSPCCPSAWSGHWQSLLSVVWWM